MNGPVVLSLPAVDQPRRTEPGRSLRLGSRLRETAMRRADPELALNYPPLFAKRAPSVATAAGTRPPGRTGVGAWMLRRALFLVCVGMLTGPASAQASSILLNGGFEDVTVDMPGSGELTTGSDAITGWLVSGTSTASDVIDWIGPGGAGPTWLVSEGTHAIDLDGRDSLDGSIYQTFATTLGQLYDVTFDLSGNPGDAPTNGLPRIKSVRAAADGFSGDYSFDTTGLTTTTLTWNTVAFSFIASGDSATLRFTSLTGTPNSYGALIDNVNVAAVPSPVPESGTFALSLLALASLASARRLRLV